MTDDTRVQQQPTVPPAPSPVAPARRSRRTFYLAAVGVLALALGAGALYLLRRTHGEPRPVPVPVAVAVVASYPDGSAEDVEKQVVIPLEIALAGIPRQTTTWSKSLPGLVHVRVLFEDGTDYVAARQGVVTRLAMAVGLPNGVSPQVLPAPGWELLWYTLSGPRDAKGRPIYTPQDLQAVQEYIVERELLRMPGVAGSSDLGGLSPRYEVRLDPERMRRYGVTLAQVSRAIADANANAGGVGPNVRAIGLIPERPPRQDKDAAAAAARLRAAEAKVLREIRRIVVVTINNVRVRVEDVVEGGPLPRGAAHDRGVVVGHAPRLGSAGVSGPGPREDEDVIWGVVWMRPGGDAATVLRDVRAKLQELNDTPGQLLPGVRVEPFHENALCGFRPRPEAGRLWVHGILPANASVDEAADHARRARKLVRAAPGVEVVFARAGRPDDGSDPADSCEVQLLVLMQQPAQAGADAATRMAEMRAELNRNILGVNWSIGQQPWDPFLPAPDEQGLTIVGSDLKVLERLSAKVRAEALNVTGGIEDVSHPHLFGLRSLDVAIDAEKCGRVGVLVRDVNDTIRAGGDGLPVTDVIEGDRHCPVVLRWSDGGRGDERAILDTVIQLDAGPMPPGLRPGARPALRLRVRDVGVGAFHTGAAAVYRLNGKRVSLLRFRVQDRDEAEALAEVNRRLRPLVLPPYRVEGMGR